MSAASSAPSQVRRSAAPAARQPAQPMRAPAGPAPTFAFAEVDSDEFKLNLSDIPRLPMSLDVEGLKPSLLSRVVDLFTAKR